MRGSSKLPTVALVAAVFLAMVEVLAAILLVGASVALDVRIGPLGASRLSLWILLAGVPVMAALFATFLYIGIEDWRARQPLSMLYWPQTAVKGAMTAYMLSVAPAAVDLLAHGLTPRWAILYTSTARIAQSALLLGVFASFLWVLATVLRGRAEGRRERREAGLLARLRATDRRARAARRIALGLARRVDANERRLDDLTRDDKE